MAISARSLLAAVGGIAILIAGVAGCASTNGCSDGSCSVSSRPVSPPYIARYRPPVEVQASHGALQTDHASFDGEVIQAR